MTACGSGAVRCSVWTKRRTLEYRAGKPCMSTRSCQIAIALRPRSSARSMSSRYGSHALAVGARPGWRTAASSVDTAGFGGPESVDTCSEMAGFGFDSLRRPRPGTGIPAAFR
jgi:hypothetical protein